jgi:hypothetical protein
MDHQPYPYPPRNFVQATLGSLYIQGEGYPPCSSPIIGKPLHGVLIELLHAHLMPYTMHHKNSISYFISRRAFIHDMHGMIFRRPVIPSNGVSTSSVSDQVDMDVVHLNH